MGSKLNGHVRIKVAERGINNSDQKNSQGCGKLVPTMRWNGMSGWYIVLYADDILLISPSVFHLELLLHACERELEWLDMAINLKKSCCLRTGTRHNATCAAITSMSSKKQPNAHPLQLQSSPEPVFAASSFRK